MAGPERRRHVLIRPFRADGTPAGPERLAATDGGYLLRAVATPGGEVWLTSLPSPFGCEPESCPREVLARPFALDGTPFGALFVGRAPAPEEVLTSPELPGFRVWALITDQAGGSRWGAAEAECLAETLCASGALPGRVEVLVRVVGPKPNGFLWPTLVKLSTSRVEVWIEQVATGELRHYVLPGASPGDDTLPGLFDRFGFEPQ